MLHSEFRVRCTEHLRSSFDVFKEYGGTSLTRELNNPAAQPDLCQLAALAANGVSNKAGTPKTKKYLIKQRQAQRKRLWKVTNHTNPLYLCALMENLNRILLVLALIGTLGMSGCKSSFEKLRAGGDYAAQLKASLDYYQKKDYQKSQILFEALMPQMRGKAEAEQVYFYYAYSHYYLGKFVTASYYFKQFASTFQNSEWKEEAEYMSAYSNYLLSPSFRLEQSNTDKGIEGLQTFINAYPESKRVPECNKLIEELRGRLEVKAFAEGQLYFDLGQYQSAIQSFENVLKDFPETRRVEDIRYMVLKSAYLLAENSVYEKKGERYALVQDRCAEFLFRHPTSKLKKEVQLLVKESEKIIKTLKK